MLISGKEAKLAWANGDEVQLKKTDSDFWDSEIKGYTCGVFDNSDFEFRLKPRTISINGIEVPAPFKPKEGGVYFYLNNFYECGYDSRVHKSEPRMFYHTQAWETEEEISQVVEALRSIFK